MPFHHLGARTCADHDPTNLTHPLRIQISCKAHQRLHPPLPLDILTSTHACDANLASSPCRRRRRHCGWAAQGWRRAAAGGRPGTTPSSRCSTGAWPTTSASAACTCGCCWTAPPRSAPPRSVVTGATPRRQLLISAPIYFEHAKTTADAALGILITATHVSETYDHSPCTHVEAWVWPSA